ncbi:MAG: HAMP domain-containing sensor histidine kinase [Gemmatimonadota bacterium]
MTLGRALIGLVVAVLLAGSVPVGLALDHRLAAALEEKAAEDLSLAPRVLADRFDASASMQMMHAKDVAQSPAVIEALLKDDAEAARAAVEEAPRGLLETPVLVDAQGVSRMGPRPSDALLEATRSGAMPVVLLAEEGVVRVLAIAPIESDGRWLGAAGVVSALDDTEAATLAGLTRSDVVVLGPRDVPVASTLSGEALSALVAAARDLPDSQATRVVAAGRRWLAARGTLSEGTASILFARDLDRELAVVPDLRRVALVSMGLALGFALLLGTLVAGRLARPVRALATAADRFAAGDLGAPLERSGVSEVLHVADAFDVMRQRLAARMRELEEANHALEDRQERLALLQSEVLQRDRLSAAGRLLTQLAHEIRNPVASVRNCLELLRRRVRDDAEAREVADLAIDELLRMHELAEQMMDLNRPRGLGATECDPMEVARQVAALAQVGADDALQIRLEGSTRARAAIAPEALKQVLVNLVQNGREAMGEGGVLDVRIEERGDRILITVLDTGPGIDETELPRIFDPFFTTKTSVQGVGLGLFTAEGLVRGAGGRLTAANRDDAHGARFEIELQAVPATVAAS